MNEQMDAVLTQPFLPVSNSAARVTQTNPPVNTTQPPGLERPARISQTVANVATPISPSPSIETEDQLSLF